MQHTSVVRTFHTRTVDRWTLQLVIMHPSKECEQVLIHQEPIPRIIAPFGIRGSRIMYLPGTHLWVMLYSFQAISQLYHNTLLCTLMTLCRGWLSILSVDGPNTIMVMLLNPGLVLVTCDYRQVEQFWSRLIIILIFTHYTVKLSSTYAYLFTTDNIVLI